MDNPNPGSGPRTEGPVKWEELTWPEIRRLSEELGMAIWCFGSIEQHGHHLPVSTDAIHANEVGERVSAATGVPMLPTMYFGESLIHGRSFPGTLSLRPETLIKVAQDVGHWLHDQGFRKLLMLSGHGGNLAPLICAGRTLLYDFPGEMQVRVASWPEPPGVREVMNRDVPVMPDYIHAGWSETSAILAIRPELVHMDRAINEDDLFVEFDYTVDQVSHSGVVGRETTEADAASGEKVLADAAAYFSERVRQMLAENPPVAVDPPAGRALER
jgi:creatinine amidohydrolase